MGTVIRPEVSTKNAYWISRHRYYELKHFCLQYMEWKQRYRDLDGFSACSPCAEEGRNTSSIPDPTAQHAQARLYFRGQMRMIEETATRAAGNLAHLMLRAVTEGVSYEHISPPCCKEVWYAAYRRFFWLLDKARK